MGRGGWCRCAQCTPRVVRRRRQEGEGDSDGKGAHPRAPGSEGETARKGSGRWGRCARTRLGQRGGDSGRGRSRRGASQTRGGDSERRRETARETETEGQGRGQGEGMGTHAELAQEETAKEMARRRQQGIGGRGGGWQQGRPKTATRSRRR